MTKTTKASQFEAGVQTATVLLRDVIEKSQNYAKVVGAHLEVNETDFSAMEHLINNGPMTAGDLAKAVGISPGSATVMIDRLVEVGHVTRSPNPNDRRGVLITPNPDSVAQAWKHISPLIMASEKLLSELSSSERAAIEKYLRAMLDVYSEVK